jgi:hypothetical protein
MAMAIAPMLMAANIKRMVGREVMLMTTRRSSVGIALKISL